jgi:hypothetical protein
MSHGSARQRWIYFCAWVFVAAVVLYYGWRMAGIGLDLRQDFWVYCAHNHMPGDVNGAMNKGALVLREARELESEDRRKESATIAHPGPGLFDSPLNAKIFLRRWRRLSPVYGHILRGWVGTYDSLLQTRGDGPDADYDLDYPPLRLLVMTLWTWRVQTDYPGVTALPLTPKKVFDPDTHRPIIATDAIVQPLLKLNAFFEGVTSISIFILVWLWMERRPKTAPSRLARRFFWPRAWPDAVLADTWGWGDPLLLVPVIVLGVCTLLRSNVSWQMPMPDASQMSLIDVRVASVGWWLFLLLRFLSAVCLARFLPQPFRAPMCALVAATLAWINPASILDSFGFPQWDAWLPPFFLIAAILMTVDWWIAAGLALGVGCMFKGQLLFVAPVLVLCPLLAGWPGRFLRIAGGLAAGAGLILWPWLVTNATAERWVFIAVLSGAVVCAIAALWSGSRERFAVWSRAGSGWWRERSAKWSPLIARSLPWLAAAAVCAGVIWALWRWPPAALLALGILIVPWFLPRRQMPVWLLLVFASALWLAAFTGSGAWSWYRIGFLYGTQKHQVMQLGATSLSNLSSILGERYDWQVHDQVTTLNLPVLGAIDLDVQQFCALVYFACALLCAAAAAMHLRRRDVRFLIALAAPWVLFVALLTQMSARYPVLPAVIGTVVIAVSAEMSLLPLLLTVLACVMLGNQMMLLDTRTSPLALTLTQPTHPGIAWAMLLLAAVFLVSALIPTRRALPRIEVA